MQSYKNKVYSKLNNTVQLTKGKTTTVFLKMPPSQKKYTTQKPMRQACFACQLADFYAL